MVSNKHIWVMMLLLTMSHNIQHNLNIYSKPLQISDVFKDLDLFGSRGEGEGAVLMRFIPRQEDDCFAKPQHIFLRSQWLNNNTDNNTVKRINSTLQKWWKSRITADHYGRSLSTIYQNCVHLCCASCCMSFPHFCNNQSNNGAFIKSCHIVCETCKCNEES